MNDREQYENDGYKTQYDRNKYFELQFFFCVMSFWTVSFHNRILVKRASTEHLINETSKYNVDIVMKYKASG